MLLKRSLPTITKNSLAVLASLSVLSGISCAPPVEEEQPEVECSDHGQLVDGACVCDSGYILNADDASICEVDNLIHGDGIATDVVIHLHANGVKIRLSDMTVYGEQETDWDLYVAHDDPVDNGPNIHLGPGVTAINLSNSDLYHDVNEAPESGYESDDINNSSFVIGSSFRAGGEGTSGFIMSTNIYAVKLPSGDYAKIEVLSAAGGEVHVLCYLQPDHTTDISTHE